MRARFYFGAMSPYAWFAAERIGALVPTAAWRPVFAAGLFRSVGRASWGLDAGLRQANVADCEVRARAHGLGSMRWPDGWPAGDILVARVLTAAGGDAPTLALAAMRAAFRDGARLEDPDTLVALATAAGLDGAALLAAARTGEVKDALRAVNDEAVAAGVFGVPTVLVDDTVYWGDDRLDEAAAAAA